MKFKSYIFFAFFLVAFLSINLNAESEEIEPNQNQNPPVAKKESSIDSIVRNSKNLRPIN